MTTRWGACLSGHNLDLLDWAEVLKQPFDPWVDVIERAGETLFVLRSEQFNRATSADELLALAGSLVARLNGALALERSCKRVATSTVVEYSEMGAPRLRVFAQVGVAEERSRAYALAVAIGPHDAPLPPPPPEPSASQRWISSADDHDAKGDVATHRADLLSDLLVHLGRCDNWFDIYKTIEFAELLAGGEHKLQNLAGTDRARIKNARVTANFHRHARTHRPDNPVTLNEAHEAARVAARIVLG